MEENGEWRKKDKGQRKIELDGGEQRKMELDGQTADF